MIILVCPDEAGAGADANINIRGEGSCRRVVGRKTAEGGVELGAPLGKSVNCECSGRSRRHANRPWNSDATREKHYESVKGRGSKPPASCHGEI